GAGQRARQLRESGWTVLPAAPGASLPALWRQAAEERSLPYAADGGGSFGAGADAGAADGDDAGRVAAGGTGARSGGES
ncbi:DUF58 domain-containing protein, partial [Streptomyces bomunensis]|nr:DUF58 domain-containing protein [Streptomyces montanisoli]